jgi:hypothetical protein
MYPILSGFESGIWSQISHDDVPINSGQHLQEWFHKIVLLSDIVAILVSISALSVHTAIKLTNDTSQSMSHCSAMYNCAS